MHCFAEMTDTMNELSDRPRPLCEGFILGFRVPDPSHTLGTVSHHIRSFSISSLLEYTVTL